MAYEFTTKLQGTAKQVAQANDIRQSIIDYYDAEFDGMVRRHILNESKVARYTKAKEAMREAAESIDSAKWWIDNRKPLSIVFGEMLADVYVGISKIALARHPELKHINLIRVAEDH